MESNSTDSLASAALDSPELLEALRIVLTEFAGLGVNILFWECDPDGVTTKLVGESPGHDNELDQGLRGQPLWAALGATQPTASASVTRLRALLERGESFDDLTLDVPRLGHDDLVWRLSAQAILDTEGSLSGFRGTAIEDGFQRFIESVPFSIIVWTEDLRIVTCNEYACSALGLKREQVKSASPATLASHVELTLEQPSIEPGAGRMHEQRMRLRTSDGSLRIVQVHVAPVLRRGDRLNMAVYIDVTDSVAAERLAQADSVANLTATLAHDLANIMMIVQEAARTVTTADRAEQAELAQDLESTLGTIRELSSRMRRLSLGKAGETVEKGRGCDPCSVAERIVRLSESGSQLRINFETHAPSGAVRPELLVNTSELERAIVNLIVNARNATGPDGKVLVTCELEQTTGGASCYRLGVEDDGPGFATTEADGAPASFEGSNDAGLGLSQVRAFVEQADGALTITHSPRLGGARVLMTFPLEDAPP